MPRYLAIQNFTHTWEITAFSECDAKRRIGRLVEATKNQDNIYEPANHTIFKDGSCNIRRIL